MLFVGVIATKHCSSCIAEAVLCGVNMASPSANPEALSTEYNRLRAATHALLADTGSLLTTLVAAPAADGDHQQIDIQLSRFWQLFDGLRKRHDEAQLSVAVLALTKSGEKWGRSACVGAKDGVCAGVFIVGRLQVLCHHIAVHFTFDGKIKACTCQSSSRCAPTEAGQVTESQASDLPSPTPVPHWAAAERKSDFD